MVISLRVFWKVGIWARILIVRRSVMSRKGYVSQALTYAQESWCLKKSVTLKASLVSVK